MNNSSICCTYETPMNVLALSVFFFHRDTWKPNSIYLAHLALADSLVLFCLPFRADYYRRGKDWIYSDAFCRILLFLLAANRAAGIFFLTAVAVDRYLKIVHRLNRINRMLAFEFSSYARALISALGIIHSSTGTIVRQWTQGKIIRVMQFILAVAAVFIICFFPSNISRIAMYVLQSGITRAIEANDTFELTVLDTLQSQRLNRHSHTTAIAQQCI
uniref:G-protein coupled receptors family 1 profile domain-containing protein n=1 Tax=Cyprinus carpio TaxID=7962 RepID=A0A8C1KIK8_CYPCA